jgi:hypothetical protein
MASKPVVAVRSQPGARFESHRKPGKHGSFRGDPCESSLRTHTKCSFPLVRKRRRINDLVSGHFANFFPLCTPLTPGLVESELDYKNRSWAVVNGAVVRSPIVPVWPVIAGAVVRSPIVPIWSVITVATIVPAAMVVCIAAVVPTMMTVLFLTARLCRSCHQRECRNGRDDRQKP